MKRNVNTIAYSFLIGDLFHYGHLKMLEVARNAADYHICGVLSDDVVEGWISPKICTYHERMEVVKSLRFVDEVCQQNSLDPTENLKRIHQTYPDAQLVLIQNHLLWGNTPGSDYIQKIHGRIIYHEFYNKLSRENIAKAFFQAFLEKPQINIASLHPLNFADRNYFQNQFSTKADTLQKLKHQLKSALIEKEFVFTVGQWDMQETHIINHINRTFQNQKIVIRSSCWDEDYVEYSNAGHYVSVLNVNALEENEIRDAVNKVIGSYKQEHVRNLQNQILVQRQTTDVIISGVVFTRNLMTNTPYYLINFDDRTRKTDSVTGGFINNKTEIVKDIPLEEVDKKWRNLLKAVREVEHFFQGLALDIEFAIKRDNTVVIFQVRPLAANSKFKTIDDELVKKSIKGCQKKYTSLCNKNDFSNQMYLSDMAFWNPAELIGDRPNYLDYSLFNYILMNSVWNKALLPLGYTGVADNLIAFIGHKPYVKVQHAFLSLLPIELPAELKKKLLAHYSLKLKSNPELHDKVEFRIVHNCYHFDFAKEERKLLNNHFSESEITLLKQSLKNLTTNIFKNFEETIVQDNERIRKLENRYHQIYIPSKPFKSWKEKLECIFQLIEDCKNLGTGPFTRVARLAFIGNSLLNSLVNTGIISRKEHDEFMESITTVATDFDSDFIDLNNNQLSIDTFLNKYGHLRPGTYDITKLPYRKNKHYLTPNQGGKRVSKTSRSKSSSIHIDTQKITRICNKHGIAISGEFLLSFIRMSIELREYYKFVYTKNISLALELTAEIGEEFGFTRKDMAHLDVYSIVNYRNTCTREEIQNIWRNLIKSRKEEKRIYSLLSLPPLIFSAKDFTVIPSYVATPNFITDAIVSGELTFLDRENENTQLELSDKIVVVEKADPGYDWIFTKHLKGLLTKYGGAASHMAIRCAEFNIPAVIGCGDIIFSRILKSYKATIDCKNKIINTV